jgi:hypothetical protein
MKRTLRLAPLAAGVAVRTMKLDRRERTAEMALIGCVLVCSVALVAGGAAT